MTDPLDPDYVITNWRAEEGLPESSATDMVQTSDGYLWFGTFNGLVRFDGSRFTVFGPNNVPAIPHSGIIKLLIDRRGRMWVGTLGGIVLYNEGRRQWNSKGVEGFANDFAECQQRLRQSSGGIFCSDDGGAVLELQLRSIQWAPSCLSIREWNLPGQIMAYCDFTMTLGPVPAYLGNPAGARRRALWGERSMAIGCAQGERLSGITTSSLDPIKNKPMRRPDTLRRIGMAPSGWFLYGGADTLRLSGQVHTLSKETDFPAVVSAFGPRWQSLGGSNEQAYFAQANYLPERRPIPDFSEIRAIDANGEILAASGAGQR
jgi:hypothetical protein